MHVLTVEDAVALILNHARYAGSRVYAMAAVRPLAALVRVPLKAYKASIVARNDQFDEVTDAEAIHDHAVDEYKEVVLDLGRQAVAHFGDREHAGFTRIFDDKAPSEITETPVAKRDEAYAALVTRAQAPATPAVFKPVVKKLADAMKAISEAKAGVAAARAVLEALESKEAEAKQDVVTGFVRLHAQLTDRFPKDAARVERFFKKVPAKKKTKKPEEKKPAANAPPQ